MNSHAKKDEVGQKIVYIDHQLESVETEKNSASQTEF